MRGEMEIDGRIAKSASLTRTSRVWLSWMDAETLAEFGIHNPVLVL
jgi:hypothetical protein